MSLQAKQELIYRMRWQYAEADRKGKAEILDGVIAATGYHRKYAITALKQPVRRLRVLRTPKRVYDSQVKDILIQIWKAANQICSKRLAPFLPEFIQTLERFGHLQLSDEIRTKLLSLSPATIDRLLKDERAKHPRGKSTTRPGNLLKQRIAVRTFADWKDTEPGFFEADLVAHCGDHVDGSFLNTLVLTDISSCWTEFAPLLRKSDADVTAALTAIREVLPILLLGIDTDNGSEFINEELFGYCEREKITFTRSRPYKKNDQSHVEQKNGSIIRRNVGYDRFEGVESWTRLMNLYRVLRLYVNFFQPSCKLLKKERVGSRVRKTYDQARTPYQRLLQSPHINEASKAKLTKLYRTLDPLALFEQLASLQENLLVTAQNYFAPDSSETPEQAPVQVVLTNQPLPPVRELNSLKPLKMPKRAYKKRAKDNRRTRKDPLEGAQEAARHFFDEDPTVTGANLLKRLQEKFPNQFSNAQLKTIQRRLAGWRRQHLAEQQTISAAGGGAYQSQACREVLLHGNPLATVN